MSKDFARRLPEYPRSLPGRRLFHVRQGRRNPRVPQGKHLWRIPVLLRRLEGRSRANRLYVP